MIWCTSSGKDAVIQRATFLAFGDSNDHTTAWSLNDMTAAGNRWVQTISADIFRSTGIWEMDDQNQTDLPSATTTLVSGQHDYQIPNTTFKIERVEVLDQSGLWHRVFQQEMQEIQQALPEYFKTNALPQFYRMMGNSIWLYPAPDAGVSVTLAAGLRLYFTRKFTTFTVPASYTTQDTTQPGFDEQFHDMLCAGMAWDWCLTNGPTDRADRLEKRIAGFREQLAQHYGVKDRDKNTRLRPRAELYT